MKEIVYQEAARGVFEPVPTRVQKRQAKLAQQKRADKIETVWGIIGISFAVIGYAVVFVLFVFSDWIWPVIRP